MKTRIRVEHREIAPFCEPLVPHYIYHCRRVDRPSLSHSYLVLDSIQFEVQPEIGQQFDMELIPAKDNE